MNGRCHKDALDRAEDICELCGEQFCASCLVFPRGHRNPPTCKGCALAHSGLRGTGSPKNPISRREYKKRKKTLLAQLEGVEEEAPAIEYFELADSTRFDTASELDRRPSKAEVPESTPPDTVDPDAVDLAGRLEETTPVPPPPPPAPPTPTTPPPPTPPSPASPPTPPAGTAEPAVGSQTPEIGSSELNGLEPVDTTINPLAIEPAAPVDHRETPAAASEASTSAADLLARLKADQPIQSQYTSAPPTATPHSLDVDPFAPPSSTPSAAPVATGPSRTAPPPSSTSSPVGLSGDPFSGASGPTAGSTTGTPTPSRPKTEPWQPPPPPPRGSNLDAMTGGSPVTGSEPNAPRPAEPQPAHPPATDSAPATPDPPPTGNPPATGNPGTATGPADTDESGQWIPPSLRGMAPPEVRAADPLPRRR